MRQEAADPDVVYRAHDINTRLRRICFQFAQVFAIRENCIGRGVLLSQSRQVLLDGRRQTFVFAIEAHELAALIRARG